MPLPRMEVRHVNNQGILRRPLSPSIIEIWLLPVQVVGPNNTVADTAFSTDRGGLLLATERVMTQEATLFTTPTPFVHVGTDRDYLIWLRSPERTLKTTTPGLTRVTVTDCNPKRDILVNGQCLACPTTCIRGVCSPDLVCRCEPGFFGEDCSQERGSKSIALASRSSIMALQSILDRDLIQVDLVGISDTPSESGMLT